MTFRRIFCLSSLVWACEGAFQEHFPLSGGFNPGMHLKITAFLLPGQAHIDFLTPLGKVGFRLSVDTIARTLTRSSATRDNFMSLEAWGGWPFFGSIPKDVTFEFVKTKTSFAVSIDGVRRPWYDFFVGDDLITEADVHGAWEDVEVLQTRPACSTVCHPDECAGEIACGGATCYSTIGGSSCSSSKDTRSVGNSHCCENRQSYVDGDAVEVGDYLEVHLDVDEVNNACSQTAFDLGPTCRTGRVLGSKVKVESVDREKRTVTAFSIVQLVENQGPTSIAFPTFILKDSPVVSTFHNITKAEMKDVTLYENIGVIKTVGSKAAAENITPYKYINVMTTHQGLERWYQWTPDRWAFVRDKREEYPADEITHIILTDGKIPTSNCTEIPEKDESNKNPWVDNDGNTCADYESKGWCTEFGKPTDAFDSEYPDSKLASQGLYFQRRSDGSSAPWVCCACGGGLRDKLDIVPSPEMMLFQ